MDLVARAGASGTSPAVVQALEAIRSEGPRLDEPLRAAAARAVAALPLPLGLLEYFASDSLSVSAPVLAAATLDSSQWTALHAAADLETKRFIETLQPGLRVEPYVEPVATAPSSSPPADFAPPAEVQSPSLHEVVERIERRRRLRAGQSAETAPTAARSSGPSSYSAGNAMPAETLPGSTARRAGRLVGRSLSRPQEGRAIGSTPKSCVPSPFARHFATPR